VRIEDALRGAKTKTEQAVLNRLLKMVRKRGFEPGIRPCRPDQRAESLLASILVPVIRRFHLVARLCRIFRAGHLLAGVPAG
jgi:hypothetical protein